MQRGDFVEHLQDHGGLPVTIRLLDPPLHEFLPQTDERDRGGRRRRSATSADKLRARAQELHESNPMLGHRGCRLGDHLSRDLPRCRRAPSSRPPSKPRRRAARRSSPEIMIPLVVLRGRARPRQGAHRPRWRSEVIAEKAGELDLHGRHHDRAAARRAARRRDRRDAPSSSRFGTNDLTQTTLGISPRRRRPFLGDLHRPRASSRRDPFVTLDQRRRRRADAHRGRARARRRRPGIKLGICGEHGGDPASIEFCHAVGLDYVSCSPFRVPIARLAAAQAALGAITATEG